MTQISILYYSSATVKKYHSRVDTLSHVRFSPNDGVNIRSHRFEAPYVQLLPSL